MTDQEKQAAAQETLYNAVFVPAFVKLAADKGINIQTEAELGEAIRLAMTLEASQAQQTPRDNSGLLKQAADSLQAHVQTPKGQVAEQSYFAKQAAALPEFRQAVAALAGK
jgi:hypothetical protein